MFYNTFKVLTMALILSLNSLTASAQDIAFPDETHLAQKLNELIKQNDLAWVVDNLEITAAGNAGTAVSPVFEQRFVATVRATETLFEQRATFANPEAFLTVWYSQNATISLYGVATSRIQMEEWNSAFGFDNVDDIVNAKTFTYFLESFQPESLFVLGTPEGDEAWAAVQERQLAAERAAAEAIEAEKQRVAALNEALGGEWIGHISCSMQHQMNARLEISTPFEPNRIQAVMALENPTTGVTEDGIGVALNMSDEGEPIIARFSGLAFRKFGSREENGWVNLDGEALQGTFWGSCSVLFERPDTFAERQQRIEAEVAAFLSNVDASRVLGTQTGPTRRPGSEWPIMGTAEVTSKAISGVLQLHGFGTTSSVKAPYGPEPISYTLTFPQGIAKPVLSVEPYSSMVEVGTRMREVTDQYSLQSRCGATLDYVWNPDTLEITLISDAAPMTRCFSTATLRFQ